MGGLTWSRTAPPVAARWVCLQSCSSEGAPPSAGTAGTWTGAPTSSSRERAAPAEQHQVPLQGEEMDARQMRQGQCKRQRPLCA